MAEPIDGPDEGLERDAATEADAAPDPDEELFDDEEIPPVGLQPDGEERTDDGDLAGGAVPDPDELPESQGRDPMDAERATEDASSRRLLSDEDPSSGPVP